LLRGASTKRQASKNKQGPHCASTKRQASKNKQGPKNKAANSKENEASSRFGPLDFAFEICLEFVACFLEFRPALFGPLNFRFGFCLEFVACFLGFPHRFDDHLRLSEQYA
jgi:hypothetical protein